MSFLGIALQWPEHLELQAILMKLIGLVILAVTLVHWGVIDGRVASMVVGGAAGASGAWLVGFRQGGGGRAVAIQAFSAAGAALAAELLWRSL